METLRYSSVPTRQGTQKLLFAVIVFCCAHSWAQVARTEVCPRPSPGSAVENPPEIRSRNGVLNVSLLLRNSVSPTGGMRYCYMDEEGRESPTLRVKPGDVLILKLKNEVNPLPSGATISGPAPRNSCITAPPDPIAVDVVNVDRVNDDPERQHRDGAMGADSTNLHFHGLSIPPVCHQDDVLHTTLQPGAAYYEYRVSIPKNQPPGLYWYHPHLHGHTEEQVLGGASGALIVEGIERSSSKLMGVPERLLIIRDQLRAGMQFEEVPRYGVGGRPPAKDLTINFIPVPYPNYPPAVVKIRPLQRELWRVLNASADTLLDLRLLTNGKWQSMGLVAIDGVPMNYEQADRNGRSAEIAVQWVGNISIPPGGRAEFIYETPAKGGRTQLLTSGVDTTAEMGEDEDAALLSGSAGTQRDDDDYTPPRWLLKAEATDAAAPPILLPGTTLTHQHVEGKKLAALGTVRPDRQRKLYFSEKLQDGVLTNAQDPKSPRRSTIFYVTEEGQQPLPFDPAAPPNITVRQGEVEDWIIENRSPEIHTFHIHQTHFLLLERDHQAVKENYLRDTVAVPYWDGVSPWYPSVRVRIDFRDPTIIGTFPYHCHILQHEDGGMMGTIRVLKRDAKK